MFSKSKILRASLILTTLIVWGLIAISFVRSPNEEFIDSQVKSVIQIDKTQELYQLHLDYEDPFRLLSQRKPLKTPVLSKPKGFTVPRPLIIARAPWPQIEYFGIIKNPKSHNVGLIRINGKNHLITAGEEFENLNVLLLNSDSITISNSEEQRSFLRKQ